MEYKVLDNFIFFPVNRNVSRKKLTFKRKGEFLFSLNVAIDYVTPDFIAKIDLSRFKGETLEITVARSPKLRIHGIISVRSLKLLRYIYSPSFIFSTCPPCPS